MYVRTVNSLSPTSTDRNRRIIDTGIWVVTDSSHVRLLTITSGTYEATLLFSLSSVNCVRSAILQISRDSIPVQNLRLSQSLGKFYPSEFRESVIRKELDLWLREVGIRSQDPRKCLPIQVREPSEHMRIVSTDRVVVQWHRDGLGDDATDPIPARRPSIEWIITWSNGTITELEGIRPFDPYSVVLFNNRLVRHRCPSAEADRWFVRLSDPIIPDSILQLDYA